MKITPDFPRAALRKGRTGYVIVKFDVTRLGNPENITFVETSNSLFRRPANKFLENMKYIQYEVPNVEKYISTDVTYRIDFNFEN